MSLTKHCTDRIKSCKNLKLTSEPEFVNVCFEVLGKSSREICDALRQRNELLVGHAMVDGQRIIRVPFVNGDLTLSDVDEMLDLVIGVADSLPAGDNAEPTHLNKSNGSCCSL